MILRIYTGTTFRDIKNPTIKMASELIRIFSEKGFTDFEYITLRK